MFTINSQSEESIYAQIEKQVMEYISFGVFVANEQLPSIRSVAMELGVNPNTVAKAYLELEDMGVIYTKKGLGSFISDNNTHQLIKDKQLDELEIVIKNLKKHKIDKEIVIAQVEALYKEK